MENKFAERLKELRTDKDIAQSDLAKKLGVSNGVISLWENGLREPGMNSILILAKFFGVSSDYLLGLED